MQTVTKAIAPRLPHHPVATVWLDSPEVTITQVGDLLRLVSADEVFECGVHEFCELDWSTNPEFF